MTDYEQLVKALRSASTVSTAWEKLMREAADAIEELDAEETRLLLITSELQDKVVELEEQLNDADIAADDNGRQIEALQAEIRESLQRCAECGDELAQQMPKLGEWKPFDLTWGRSIYSCTVCGEAADVPTANGKVLYNYCPSCGAKMEVQE